MQNILVNLKQLLVWLRRRWWLFIVLAVVVLLAAYTARSLLLSATSSLRTSTSPSPPDETCSPHPCAAPQGFEAHFSSLTTAGNRVTMQVSFRNNTSGGGLEAVSYRHTSPDDFRLKGADGKDRAPVFSAGCPDWGELDIERGDAAGPEKLCFDAPPDGLKGAVMIWSPDLGFFFQSVTVPLG